jgi:TatD DNase family protein
MKETFPYLQWIRISLPDQKSVKTAGVRMIFESHAHYDDVKFDEDRETLLESLPANGIECVVNVGASMKSSQATYSITEKYPYIYGAVGVHPNETADLTEEDMETLARMVQDNKKIVAIGEIGLDYYWDEPDRATQKKWFERQIELARKLALPMIIHSRDAAADTWDIMSSCKCGEIGGVVHCFSYAKEEAKKYLDMGFYLGIGGVVTFKNAVKIKEVVQYAPLDRILLETDSPYLAPVPNRGSRNSSLNLPYVVAEIARIRGVSEEEIIEATNQNARKMFHLKK